jgi:hypothetical protein
MASTSSAPQPDSLTRFLDPHVRSAEFVSTRRMQRTLRATGRRTVDEGRTLGRAVPMPKSLQEPTVFAPVRDTPSPRDPSNSPSPSLPTHPPPPTTPAWRARTLAGLTRARVRTAGLDERGRSQPNHPAVHRRAGRPGGQHLPDVHGGAVPRARRASHRERCELRARLFVVGDGPAWHPTGARAAPLPVAKDRLAQTVLTPEERRAVHRAEARHLSAISGARARIGDGGRRCRTRSASSCSGSTRPRAPAASHALRASILEAFLVSELALGHSRLTSSAQAWTRR